VEIQFKLVAFVFTLHHLMLPNSIRKINHL